MKASEDHSFDKVCSVLVKEPFNLPISEIKNLTPYQVKHIYFRQDYDDPEEQKFKLRRDRKKPKEPGGPVLKGEGVTYEAIFRKRHEDNGKSKEEIDLLWQKYLVDKANKPPAPPQKDKFSQ